jgi:arylsulfatase A-like enzyme
VTKHVIVLLAITSLILSSVGLGQSDPRAEPRPNIVFILVDDLRWDELGITGHPFLKTPNIDRIGSEGALFRNAFVTTPLCSPSRASFLTGLYPHTHGITDNIDRSVASHKLITFPLLLRQSGYATAFIGKWHMGNDDSPRPGFDRWVSFKGQGSYINPEINEDGKDINPRGYITDILNQYAVEFIRRPHNKPFLVYLAHKAIHPEVMQHGDGSVNLDDAERFIPAERHKKLFMRKKIPRRPSAMQPPTGKPALQRQIGDLPPLGPNTATRDEVVLGRLRSLMAVEEGVREIFSALKETGQLDNTVIVFSSDNGYFYGEHGLSVERRLAYEESIRMPLLMRYPKLIKAGTVRDEFALNIDVAPTLLELAGVSAPKVVQGRSLVSLLKGGETDWRNSFLIEYYSDRVFPRIRQMGYKAIRNERWKYIHYFELEGMDELYDLKADPYEMKNIINQPAAAEMLNKMKREMEQWQQHIKINFDQELIPQRRLRISKTLDLKPAIGVITDVPLSASKIVSVGTPSSEDAAGPREGAVSEVP